MKLGLFLAGYGHHVASWRHEEANDFGPMDIEHLINITKKAEEGKFDLLFLADSLYIDEKSHPNIVSRFEPLTLLSVIARETHNIGLVSTASTTYEEPFHLARKFSSLDHISNGRAGWNIVTSSITNTAENFNGSKHMEHELRYKRADEFVDVAKKLWKSLKKEDIVRNKVTGEFVDESKIKPINHIGEIFKVKGPLNIEMSPQIIPFLIQAGSSPTGIKFGAKHADAIFTAQNSLEKSQKFYENIKKEVIKSGRNTDSVSIMPGLFPIIGDTVEEANEIYQQLQDLVLPEVGLNILSKYMTDINLLDYNPDVLFSSIKIKSGNGSQSRLNIILQDAIENNLSLRDVYKKVAGSRGHNLIIGTPDDIANTMEEWFLNEAADGFNVMPPLLTNQFDKFVDDVIPLLQERGLVQKDYNKGTLREKFKR